MKINSINHRRAGATRTDFAECGATAGAPGRWPFTVYRSDWTPKPAVDVIEQVIQQNEAIIAGLYV